MNGFFITVKNGLLDNKHIKAMGGERCGTVWLFLWLLDKMTIIDHEKGEGKVLGGKPIKYMEVFNTIGISQRTYQKYVSILRKSGYISTNRTPQGLQITVNKAAKIFGNKDNSDTHGSAHQIRTEAHIRYARKRTSNKTVQLDNTKDITNKPAQSAAGEDGIGVQVNAYIDIFRAINPTINFGNTTNRKAAEYLIKKFGLEVATQYAKYAVSVFGKQWAPTITTPHQLKEDLSKLAAYGLKQKEQLTKINIIDLNRV